MRSSHESWLDVLAQWVARCLPHRVRYWVYIQAAAKATTHPKFRNREVPGISVTETLEVLPRG